MLLKHITHMAYLEPITEQGLLCRHARGKWPVIWLCREDMVAWAIKHLCKHRQWKPEHLVVLTIDAGKKWLRPHWDGIFLHFRDVPPVRIVDCEYVKLTACGG